MSAKIETTEQLAAWAEKEIAKRATGEVAANPAAEATGDEQKAVSWRGRDLSSHNAIMYYQGRIEIDSIHGSMYLSDLDETPTIDSVLWSGRYEIEIRAIRRLPR